MSTIEIIIVVTFTLALFVGLYLLGSYLLKVLDSTAKKNSNRI